MKTESRDRWTRVFLRHSWVWVLAAIAAGAPPAAAATLSFVPTASEVHCDELVEVDVSIDASVDDLRGMSIVLDFDAELLELVEVQAGQLFVDAPCDPFLYSVTVPTGITQIDVGGLGCSVAGPGPVARLRLRGRADGVSPLRGLSAILRTSENADIPTEWGTGLVLVSCPIPLAVQSWGLVKASFR